MNIKRKRILSYALVVACILCCGCGATEAAPQETNKPTVTAVPTPTAQLLQDVFHAEDVPLHDVDSTCFSRIGYDDVFEVLVVEFLDSRAIYAYYEFTKSDYDAFVSASSLGKYFNANIKGSYDYERVK